MSVNAATTDPTSDHPHRLRLRSPDDRCCPNCGEVSLVFDTGTARARCRSCGALD